MIEKELTVRAAGAKMIATDLDGTLLDQKHTLTDENKTALETLAARGLILAAATGRARTSIPESVTALRGVKYLITANGAKIFENETDEIIFEKYISAAALEYVAPLLADKKVLCEVFWDGTPHVEETRYNGAPEYGVPFWFSDYFFSSRLPVKDFAAAVKANKDKIENLNFVFAEDAVKARVRDFLRIGADRDLFELTSAFPFNFEIESVGVSKAAALDFVAARERILPEEIIAFGDNENDVCMVAYAGIGVATANAVPNVLAAADFVTTDNAHSGVAHALKTLGLI